MDTQAQETAASRLPLVGLLLVQILIGYEWLMSGVTKVVRGGFPSGLADELTDKSADTTGWYKSFLDSAVIPNGQVFGYLIMVGEILVGVGLVAAALVWLFGWDRLATGGRTAVLVVTALAALGGVVMNVNFHLANASAHPWLIPRDGFDEGIDLDSLMPAIQLVLVVVSVGLLLSLRARASRRATIGQATAQGA